MPVRSSRSTRAPRVWATSPDSVLKRRTRRPRGDHARLHLAEPVELHKTEHPHPRLTKRDRRRRHQAADCASAVDSPAPPPCARSAIQQVEGSSLLTNLRTLEPYHALPRAVGSEDAGYRQLANICVRARSESEHQPCSDSEHSTRSVSEQTGLSLGRISQANTVLQAGARPRGSGDQRCHGPGRRIHHRLGNHGSSATLPVTPLCQSPLRAACRILLSAMTEA